MAFACLARGTHQFVSGRQRELVCTLSRGHTGPHSDLGFEWWDLPRPAEPAAEPAKAVPRPFTRAETGPMQFGSDAPGLFIRGDATAHLAEALEVVLRTPGVDIVAGAVVSGLCDELRGCRAPAPGLVQRLRAFPEAAVEPTPKPR